MDELRIFLFASTRRLRDKCVCLTCTEACSADFNAENVDSSSSHTLLAASIKAETAQFMVTK